MSAGGTVATAAGVRATRRARDASGHQARCQERDTRTGLDHFPARDYTSTWAVFTRPDPAPWNLADPQTLDRYVYTADNPVTLTDPTGLTPCAGKSGAPCKVKNVVEEKHPGSSAHQQNGGTPAPTNPGGTPKSPNGDVPNPPNGKPPGWKPGDPLVPNRWAPGKGTRDRGSRWNPEYPVPGQSQPNVSWDDRGHWDYNDGKGNRTRWLPGGGGQVDHNNNPIAKVGFWTAAGAITVRVGVAVGRAIAAGAEACVESGACEAIP